MLIKVRHLEGIRAGDVRCAFRCWKRATVKAGGTLKTAVGLLSVDAVTPVFRKDLTEKDAEHAGFASLDELRRELSGRKGTLYRIDLSYAGADPRKALRERADLDDSELEALVQRLSRMDARSRHGPWTLRVLKLIRDQPATRAGDLARELKREKLAFKRDVRKLKELGLTESLETGYRLSPRGERVLESLGGR